MISFFFNYFSFKFTTHLFDKTLVSFLKHGLIGVFSEHTFAIEKKEGEYFRGINKKLPNQAI